MEKRGVAGMIAIIITIVIAIAGFLVFYNLYSTFLRTQLGGVNADAILVDGEIEYYLPDNFAIVNVHRKNDKANVSGLDIIFTEKTTGVTYLYNTADVPPPLGTKKYVIFADKLNPPQSSPWTFGNIGSISIHYVFPTGKISKELDKKDIAIDRISTDLGKRWYCDKDHDGFGANTPEYKTKPDAETACTIISAWTTPINGDCWDNTSPLNGILSNLINPSATEQCNPTDDPAQKVDENCNGRVDEYWNDCKRNYTMSPLAPIRSYWINEPGETPADRPICNSWTTIDTSNPASSTIPVPDGYRFYSYDRMTGPASFAVCNKGHLSFAIPSGCYPTQPTTSAILKTEKIIAPYFLGGVGAISTVKMCVGEDYMVFKWTDNHPVTPFQAEAIWYKNGQIIFSYNKGSPPVASYPSTSAISFGDNLNYNTMVSSTSQSYDYVLDIN
ncbi:Uncharacterised protein [uncultured archaeon]|nr:Uncharacterised protein [uncultured archaeon]